MSGNDNLHHEINRNEPAALGNRVRGDIELPPLPHSMIVGRWALVIFGSIGTIIGGYLLVSGHFFDGLSFLLLIISVLMLIPGSILMWMRSRSRARISFFEKGLMVQRKNSRVTIVYDEVRSISAVNKKVMANGVTLGYRWKIGIRTESGTTRLNFLLLGENQTAHGVIETMIEEITDSTEARIGRGERMAGRKWFLDHQGIHVKGKEVIPLNTVVRVSGFKGRFKLWCRGTDQPFLSIPKNSVNAHVLAHIVSRHIPEKESETPQAGDLGLNLFDKRALPLRWAMVLFLIGLAMSGSCGIVFFTSGFPNAEDLVFGLAIAGGGVLLVLISVVLYYKRYEIFENGISIRSVFGRRQLKYTDVGAISFRQVRQYVHGVYTQTSYSLKLFPVSGGRSMTLSGTSRGEDEDIGALEEHISAHVAEYLLKQIEDGRSVEWGKNALLTPDGIQTRGRRWFRSGKKRLVPYSADLRIATGNGLCKVFLSGEKKAFLKIRTSTRNFFPGIKVLGVLVGKKGASTGNTLE